MDTGTFRGIITGLLIIAFLGLTFWAYSKRRKPDFDEAANLPFADDQPSFDEERPSTDDTRTSSDDRRRDTDPRHGGPQENQGDKNT
ncbi:cbb3-type cytochrome oxidase subunit 3 [Halomonas jincaotanensis]|uniref:cbb3-type cytochrome oxidase subunit 3 n=1 Tax=Halomonas jincaotanensis TaxID=2810616 RepID=UPI002022BA61|nr:cbb3-type cytochrome c oxidase subunit 3 [Halomonas jincaotanensis]